MGGFGPRLHLLLLEHIMLLRHFVPKLVDAGSNHMIEIHLAWGSQQALLLRKMEILRYVLFIFSNNLSPQSIS